MLNAVAMAVTADAIVRAASIYRADAAMHWFHRVPRFRLLLGSSIILKENTSGSSESTDVLTGYVSIRRIIRKVGPTRISWIKDSRISDGLRICHG